MKDNQNIKEILPLLLTLQEEKERCYGSSWCKRGEQRGIMANIDRKYDRLDTIANSEAEGTLPTLKEIEQLLREGKNLPNEETKVDTISDLAIYCLLYMTYVKDNFPLAFEYWKERNVPKVDKQEDSISIERYLGTTVHELKINEQYFEQIQNGSKTYEVRFNDRGFKEGDIVKLYEKNFYGEPTGRGITARIGYVLDNEEFVKKGYVVFSLLDVEKL